MSNGWRGITIISLLSWCMKLLLILMLPYAIYIADYPFAVLTIISIALSLAPNFVERSYRVHLPFELDLLITLAIFFHMFFGEVLRFYERVYMWDKFLHFYSSFVIALIGFLTAYAFHYTKKIRLTLPLVWFFTIVFALAVGALWEIAEFGVDRIFDKETQKSLEDTMWDLIVDLTGGFIMALLGVIYVKYTNPETRKRLTKTLGEVLSSIKRNRNGLQKIKPGDNRRRM